MARRRTVDPEPEPRLPTREEIRAASWPELLAIFTEMRSLRLPWAETQSAANLCWLRSRELYDNGDPEAVADWSRPRHGHDPSDPFDGACYVLTIPPLMNDN